MVTEKKGLKKREKILLFIMIIVALFAGMVMLVIIPLYEQLEDQREEYGKLQVEKAHIDAMLASEQNVRDGRNQAVERHKLDSSRFLDDSHSSEIGRMLTILCERHGLLPVDQRLEDPKDFSVDENNTSGNTARDTVFVIMSATMNLAGNYSDVMRLLDEVEGIDYIRVSGLSYSWSVNPDVNPLDKINIVFEVTMIKDVDFSKVENPEQQGTEEDDENWHGLDLS